jgi:hypothetical protein
MTAATVALYYAAAVALVTLIALGLALYDDWTDGVAYRRAEKKS